MHTVVPYRYYSNLYVADAENNTSYLLLFLVKYTKKLRKVYGAIEIQLQAVLKRITTTTTTIVIQLQSELERT